MSIASRIMQLREATPVAPPSSRAFTALRFFARTQAVLCCALLPGLFFSARANDDQLVFSEFATVSYGTPTFNNGWQDNGWGPRYCTNNPVHSGTNAYCLAPNGSWQAIKFVHGDIDTSLYTNLVLWVNGGPVGGQSVGVSALLGGVEQTRKSIGINNKLPTNSWLQVVLTLASLGVDNKTNFDGIEIWSNIGATQPAFYVDDISLVAKPSPATVHVSVNATQVVRAVDARVFGINTAAWDGNLDTAATLDILNNLGNPALRWPGGSWGDSYHWTNEPWSTGATSARNWGSFSTNFIHVATNTHAPVFIIANYGSSTPEEAAYGVRMFNVTNHCAFKYWEIGNECGGSWETDNNTNAPWQPHDPWTYALRFTNYYAQMKAVDPTIKIGAVADITEDGTANYTNHPVVNPRTGVSHNGWTPVMLTYLKTNGVIPDFLIEHKYAPSNGDTWDLLYSKTWTADAAGLRQMLSDYLGSAGTNVELVCTENGCGGDRQRVSLVGGLFYADSVGQLLQTEFNARLWWDLRNGQGSITNSDPALYGWRTNSSGYFYYDEGIVYSQGYPTNRYPAYYCAKLLPRFAGEGDKVVAASSDYPLLAAYGAKRTNGNLTLLVINKSSYASLSTAIAVSGYLPVSNATIYAYGIPQDEAARTNGTTQAQDLAMTSFPGASAGFSYSFPPLSLTLFTFAPMAPRLAVLAPAPQPGGQLILQLQGQAGVRYAIESSSDLKAWTAVSTNTLAGTLLNLTNPVPAGAAVNFWRAVWQP
jgi:hypothetical protein